MLLPEPRGEFRDASRRMLPDALEDIDQIVVWVDAMEAAGHDQALYDAHLLGAELGPAEIPVLPAHGDGPQGAFQVIGVDRHVRVGEEYFQSQAA